MSLLTSSRAVCQRVIHLQRQKWMRQDLGFGFLRRAPQRRLLLSEAVKRRVEAITSRHDEVMERMNSAGGDTASLGKELSSLAPVASIHERLQSMAEEEQSLKDLMKEAEEASDAEMGTECEQELERLEQERNRLEQRIIEAILPKDEDDYGSDAILEIRAGTGGDEAALFAAELLDAYSKAAKERGWTVETLSLTKTYLGGIKEAALSIGGSKSYGSYGAESEDFGDSLESLGPYGLFKFESGVHRVQRVPVNDVRIHTSACSVAVLPSAPQSSSDDTQVLPLSELRIDTFRASGAGGQHVNTTDSAVRITHIPTGITAAIQDERSQHKNKAKALKLVTARVRDQQREAEARERGEARNSLMGGGDRSERIRTYNFPQDRVTDHRCKQSEHGIAKLLNAGEEGLVVTFAPFMRELNREELMRQLEEEEEE